MHWRIQRPLYRGGTEFCQFLNDNNYGQWNIGFCTIFCLCREGGYHHYPPPLNPPLQCVHLYTHFCKIFLQIKNYWLKKKEDGTNNQTDKKFSIHFCRNKTSEIDGRKPRLTTLGLSWISLWCRKGNEITIWKFLHAFVNYCANWLYVHMWIWLKYPLSAPNPSAVWA